MTAVSSIALSGVQAASAHLDASAHNIANNLTPGFRREQVLQQTQEHAGVLTSIGKADEIGADLAADLVQQMQASYNYKANLRTIEVNNRMMGSLLDIQA